MSTRRRSERRARTATTGTLLAFAAVAGLLVGPTRARADDDALAPYRERFRTGMESYKSGAVADAIRIWRAIYEEIGPSRGYRLSYNLGRAYDVNGEATRAAERYESFLEEARDRYVAQP